MKKETWRTRHGKKWFENKKKTQRIRPNGIMFGKHQQMP